MKPIPENFPCRRGRLAGLLLVLVLPAAALSACGSEQAGSDAQQVAVKITDDGCEPGNLKAVSGAVTFVISNPSSDASNEFEILDGSRVLGEKENLIAGLSGELTLNLDPGSYDVVCGSPGNREPTGTLTVTGTAETGTGDPKLKRAADG